MRGGKRGAWDAAWGMLTLSLGNVEGCRHLPVLDGAWLHPFAAMGAPGLWQLKRPPPSSRLWCKKGARWGKPLCSLRSHPRCLQRRPGGTSPSPSAFPCSACTPHCLRFSLAAPPPRVSHPREKPTCPGTSQRCPVMLGHHACDFPRADALQQSGSGPTAHPHTCTGYAGSSRAWGPTCDGQPGLSRSAEQALMLSAAATQHLHHGASCGGGTQGRGSVGRHGPTPSQVPSLQQGLSAWPFPTSSLATAFGQSIKQRPRQSLTTQRWKLRLNWPALVLVAEIFFR